MSTSRIRRTLGLALGIENEEIRPADEVVETPAPAEGDPEATPAPAEGEGEVLTEVVEVEPLSNEGTEGEAVLETVEEAQKIDELSDTIETLEEDHIALESLILDLRKATKDGGLSPQSAVFYKHALRGYAGRFVDTDRRVPSLESFGGASGRLRQSQVSLEEAEKTAGGFVDGLVKMIVKAWEWLKNFAINLWQKVFPTIQQKAEKVLESAKATKGTAPADAEVKYPTSLTVEGASVSGFEFANAVKHLADKVDVVFLPMAAMSETITALSNAIGHAITKGGKAEGISEALSMAVQQHEKLTANMTPSKDNRAPEGAMFKIAVDKLLGSKEIIASVPTGGGNFDSPEKALGVMDFKLIDAVKKPETDLRPIKPLTPAEAKAAMESNIDIIKAVNASKGGDKIKATKGLVDTFTKQCDALVKQVNKTDAATSDDKAATRKLINGCSTYMNRVTLQFTGNVAKYLVTTTTAVTQLCGASVKAAGGKAVADEPADAKAA